MSDAMEKKNLWQSPAAIFLVALTLRLVAVRLFYNSTWNEYEDHLYFGFETGRIARSIAEGHGFGNPLSVPTGPTAWLTPIYPYLVAAVFKLFGVYSKASALVLLSLNSLFSALVCFPLFHAAKRSFGRSVSVTACWIWTLFPYFIYIPAGFVWDTCLGGLLVATLFLFALKLKDQPGSRKNWFGFGVLGGLCTLTNASTLTLCPILAAWAIYPLWNAPRVTRESQTPDSARISLGRPLWLSPAILVTIGLMLTLLPWQIRNYRTFHTSVPLRTPFWAAFWVGNDGDTSSWMDLSVHPTTSTEEQAAFARLGEISYMQEKRRQSLAFLAQHPGLYVVLCFRRFVYVWTGFWNFDPSNVQDEFHGFANVYLTLSLTATMLLGLWRAWRNPIAFGEGAISGSNSRQTVLPYALVLFFYPLVFYLSSPTIRYRHVIDPEVVVLSALCLRSLLPPPSSSQRRISEPIRSAFLFLLLSAVSLSAAPTNAQAEAQESALPETNLVLRTSPHPRGFFDVTGRKSAVFGTQNGLFEAWIYPIKLLHDFRIDFQPQGQLEPIRGETLLQQIITRPESTTLVYAHPNFTVREVISTALAEPAVLIFFEVDTSKPLEITAAFVPDFKPMWPASFGGQHSDWNAEEKAIVLTEGTEHPTALIGSPAVSAYSELTDHQLGANEILLRIHADANHSGLLASPFVMALDMESEAKARAVYKDVVQRAREFFEKRVQFHRQFLARTLSLETPDPDLNRDFAWAKVALDSGWVCHPEYGCGLVAGYGPSGVGERPGFAWWFGGDALMASWALEDYGDLPGALQALRFLKARQRADGKMLHELTQSGGLLDWFGKYGYAYYHADTTPMYLYSLAQYWRRTGDRNFLREFWDSAQKAYAYCVSTVSPEDGLMDNRKAGLAAVEVGVLRGKVVKDIYLEGFWLAAAESMSELAAAMDDAKLAGDANARATKARESLQKNWWIPEQNAFAFGMTADARRTEMLGAWPAVLLALSEQIDSRQANQAAGFLARPELATDWGVRWLTNQSPLYDPVSYNNGSAWPFISGIAAWAEYRRGLPLAGFSLWSSLANLTNLSSPGMLPELMNGDRFLPGEHAVPHQLFSSVGVVLPAVRGLLGLEAAAIGKASDTTLQVTFAPNLPADWPFVRFHQFAFGEGHLSGEVLQQRDQTILRLQYDGSTPVRVKLAPALPALSRIKTVRLDGAPQKYSVQEFGSFVRVETAPVLLSASRQLTLTVEHEGGIGIVPPTSHPQSGERTSSLKILDAQSDRQNPACALRLILAGHGGNTYPFRVVTSLPNLQASVAQPATPQPGLHTSPLQPQKIETGFVLSIPFDGSAYSTRQLCLSMLVQQRPGN